MLRSKAPALATRGEVAASLPGAEQEPTTPETEQQTRALLGTSTSYDMGVAMGKREYDNHECE